MHQAHYKPTLNSYFAGGGLIDIGLQQSGCVINKAFEIDRDACKTYRHNFDHPVDECDITKITVCDQDDVDAMVFTYPCTKYSTIANIHATRTGDELYLHALRHLVLKSPEMYWIENVPGMRAFPIVMEAMSKLPNYYIQVFCPVDASNWLPQNRKRLIIVGTKSNFGIRPPEGTKRVKLRDIIEADPEVTLPAAIKARMNGEYRDLPIISDPSDDNAIAPTCVAHYSKDKSTRLVKDDRFPMGVRPYSVTEFARLQGVPDWFKFPVSNTQAYKIIGNGVAVPMGEWMGRETIRYFNRKTAK